MFHFKMFKSNKFLPGCFLYLQVDKHIRRLDADLARFENELKEKLEVSGYESTEGRGVKSKLVNCWLSILKRKQTN